MSWPVGADSMKYSAELLLYRSLAATILRRCNLCPFLCKSATFFYFFIFFSIFSQSTGEKSGSFPSQLSVLIGKENIGVRLWKSPNFIVDSESRSCMYVHISAALMLLRVDSSYVSEGAESGVSNITWGYCWLADKSSTSQTTGINKNWAHL